MIKTMEKTDEQLIAQFLQGDESAFAKLLHKYLKHVYNFIYQFVQDAAASEDLAQETFIKAWKNLKHFDQTKNFKVWLFAIAKNTAYDWLKKKKTIPFAFFEDEEGNNRLENIAQENVLPDELLMQKDVVKELEAGLAVIPAKYRLLLLMRYREDFSLAEIAQILHLPYNTVKSSHGRALKSLRKALEEGNASNLTSNS